MKIKKIIKVFGLSAMLFAFQGCELEDGRDLNGAPISSVSSGLTEQSLPQVVNGILSSMRIRIETQVDAVSVLGRDYWRFQSSDPRWVADLLVGNLDNNTFYTTTPYASRYRVVKECNVLLEGLKNVTVNDFSEDDKAYIRGFANTIKAYELLSVLNLQYENGIRLDVANIDNLGPFVKYQDALTEIIKMLQTAAQDLKLKEGDDPDVIINIPNTLGVTYYEFNRAITARAAAYAKDYDLVLEALGESFMDLTGNMDKGAYMIFSTAGSDITNLLFFAKNSTASNARIVHPDFLASAEAGDLRVSNKTSYREAKDKNGVLQPNPLSVDNLTGDYDVYLYDSLTDAVPIIRNEELILLYAEANLLKLTPSVTNALTAINRVRDAASLGDVATVDVDRLLFERRYSLYGEGHRWYDLRRFGKLDDIVLDRVGDKVVSQFPIPATENQ